MKKILLALTAALTLSSCGLYTKYEGRTTVDAKLYGDKVDEWSIGSDTTNMMGKISWKNLFSDTKLQTLVEQALTNNTDLRTAVLNVEIAQTAVKTSRLAFLPSLSLSAEGSISGLMEGGEATKTYTVPLSASWEIDIFGRLRNDRERAQMVAEQVGYVEQAVRTEIVAAVANLYYTLGMLDDQIKISTLTLESVTESVTTARALKEAGLMNEAGLAQLEANLYSVKNSKLSLVQARKESSNALCSLLAITPQQIEVTPLVESVTSGVTSIGVPLQMISSRPDVMAAEAALAASFYSENMARSSLYPSLTLSGAAGWTNDLGTVVVNPAELIYNLVGNVVQPIFSRGLNRAQLEVAKRTFEQSRLSFEQTLLDAGIEVNTALVQLASTKEQARNYRSQVAALEVAERSTKLLMEHGSTTYLEVLTAQQTLYSAQLQQVNNQYAQLSSFVALYKSLGGGRF